jgi:hypothetical protein
MGRHRNHQKEGGLAVLVAGSSLEALGPCVVADPEPVEALGEVEQVQGHLGQQSQP